jgi:hypothetical protein
MPSVEPHPVLARVCLACLALATSAVGSSRQTLTVLDQRMELAGFRRGPGTPVPVGCPLAEHEFGGRWAQGTGQIGGTAR